MHTRPQTKIRTIMLDIPHELFLLHIITRGHNRKYQIPFQELMITSIVSFRLLLNNLWNSLPETTVKLDSLEEIRTSVTDFLNKQ